MPDREKIIKGLEHCRRYGTLCGMDCSGIFTYEDNLQDIIKKSEHRHDCPYGKSKTGCVVTLVDDAIALLKEQPEIIQCKNCKDWDDHTEDCGNEHSPCFSNKWCKPDFFCAYGKRRQ